MTPAEERNEEAVEAMPDEAPTEAAGEAPEAAADAAPTSSPDPPKGGGEPVVEEELTPKQRRKLKRSRADGPPGAQLSGEERAEARAERRRTAAKARRRGRARQREKRGDERREGTPAAEPRAVARKARVGTVVSDRAEKSITVRIETARRHPAYEKIIRRSSTLHAHDESNDARIGDLVKVVETRPVSRTKRWRLVEVVKRAR